MPGNIEAIDAANLLLAGGFLIAFGLLLTMLFSVIAYITVSDWYHSRKAKR